MLDSPKGVCADQIGSEYPATFVLLVRTAAQLDRFAGRRAAPLSAAEAQRP
jgi:hypothetical protein